LVAAVLLAKLAEPLDLLGAGLDVVVHADPAVAGACGAAQRSTALAPDEDRWVGRLHALRLEHGTVEVEELAVVRGLGLGPQLLAHLERLVDAPTARREVELSGDPLFLEPARAHAKDGAPSGDDVQRLHGAGCDERMAQSEVVD